MPREVDKIEKMQLEFSQQAVLRSTRDFHHTLFPGLSGRYIFNLQCNFGNMQKQKKIKQVIFKT